MRSYEVAIIWPEHYHLTKKKSKCTKRSIKTIQLGLSVFGDFVGWKKTQSDWLQDETEVWKRMCPEVRCAVAVIHSKLLDGSVENGSKTTVLHFFSTNIQLAPGKMVLAFKIPLPETNIAPENWWKRETKSPSFWEGLILRGELVFLKEIRTFPLQLTFHFHDSRWGNAQKGTKIHQVAGNTCLVFFHVSIYVTYIILYIFSLYFTNTEILRTYIHIFVSMEM